MRQQIRNIGAIAWTLMLEAWRRRDIYVIVLLTVLLLIAVRMLRFFELEALSKFYRDVSLKTMNLTTGAVVIILAARQLPREFSNRTIYPLLAKPISRVEFLVGKYLGVVAGGVFCYLLFMVVFLIGVATLEAPVVPTIFLQAVYLQILSIMVLTALVFLLSMMMHPDATITLSAVLFIASQVFLNLMGVLYDFTANPLTRGLILAMHFVIPQLTLFDASAKVVHSTAVEAVTGRQVVVWSHIPWNSVAVLTAYAVVYVAIYLAFAHLLFRRRPL